MAVIRDLSYAFYCWYKPFFQHYPAAFVYYTLYISCFCEKDPRQFQDPPDHLIPGCVDGFVKCEKIE